ncbi:hypothetical protein [Thermaurantiacus sp.]
MAERSPVMATAHLQLAPLRIRIEDAEAVANRAGTEEPSAKISLVVERI